MHRVHSCAQVLCRVIGQGTASPTAGSYNTAEAIRDPVACWHLFVLPLQPCRLRAMAIHQQRPQPRRLRRFQLRDARRSSLGFGVAPCQLRKRSGVWRWAAACMNRVGRGSKGGAMGVLPGGARAGLQQHLLGRQRTLNRPGTTSSYMACATGVVPSGVCGCIRKAQPVPVHTHLACFNMRLQPMHVSRHRRIRLQPPCPRVCQPLL
jgi:hypothetical protein